MLTVVLVGVFYWSWGSPLANLERPEESLERLVSREMDFHEVTDEMPAWELRLYELTGAEPETLEDAIVRFDELDEDQRSARGELNLVVLLGESGQLERAAAMIEALEATDTAATEYARWLDAAYLDAPPAEEATAMAEEIRRELPRDWFTDTLVRRIATRVDDPALEADSEATIEARGRALLARVRVLTAAAGAMLLAALVLLWRLPRSPRGARVADAPLPPQWRGADGLGLFFRAAFAYLLMPALVLMLLPRVPASTAIMGLLGGLPMLWWLRRYLHARGDSIRDTFGLRVRDGSGLRVLGWGLVLLGLSLAGESLLSIGLNALGVTSHWADGFLEDFLWGSPASVAAGTVDGVVWAPTFEELAFRGLLYPTLRLRLPPWPAALLSSALFGVAHGYGLQGFVAVTWSGMIWALGYERTRSLVPGILAHAASNLLATTSFLLLLRF
ncbi:MAG TPA: type II CAAX endopeptidase family protein [Candidatus Deferrimicrobiaceae bacterium]|nr:type II CAAX endopeptidase family protein [Candidatus Deferrimicrobiaceae bacterium]